MTSIPLSPRSWTAVAVALLIGSGWLSAAPVALPVNIPANAPEVRYVGRFDMKNPAKPRCGWSASTVELNFVGTDLDVLLDGSDGNDRMQVVVDGQPTSVITVAKGDGQYPVVRGIPVGAHRISLIKRTEGNTGTVTITGFKANAGGRLQPVPETQPPRHLEVIGDSISCGYGNEGASQNQHFSAATENAWMAYGAIAARKFGADYTCIAWSGRKMWPDNTTPSIYGRTIPKEANDNWKYEGITPNAIVINLATNDFGKGNPEKAGWTKAYREFIERLRGLYPQAMIYVASGSMMTDGWPKGNMALTTAKAYMDSVVQDLNVMGDKRVKRIDFEPQDMNVDGLGSDWHPNIKTHQKMAAVLEAALERDMGWAPLPAP